MKGNTTLHTCKACGNRFTGKYCNACGEKVFDEGSKSLAHLGEEAFHFITHFEGTFFTTLKAVFTKPGQLSLDYCNGIRKKYFKPVPFFLFMVVLYLLFPRFQGLNMRLETYLNKDFSYYPLAAPLAQKKIAAFDGNFQEMAKQYNSKSAKVAKPLIFIMIPLTGLLLFVLFGRRRRYYFDHVILATEFNAFYIAFNFLLIPFLMVVVSKWMALSDSLFEDEGPVWLLAILYTAAYVVVAFRRFYSIKWWQSILKGVLFLIGFNLVIEYFYKMVLYYCVMLMI